MATSRTPATSFGNSVLQTDKPQADHATSASRSLLAAGIGVIIALVYGYHAFASINASPLDDLITASGFPKILAGLLLLLSLIELVSGLASRRAIPKDETFKLFEPVSDRKLWEGPLLVLVTGFVYVLIAPIVGYPFAIVLVAAATAVAAGARNALAILTVSAGISIAYFILFQFVMGTGQPLGFLSDII